MKCCICGKEIHGHSNSPAPIDGDYCCDECNLNIVVPYRLFLHSLGSKRIAMLVKPDKIELVKPKQKYFTLKELQTAVGGYIELYANAFTDVLTIVNEEGLLKNLPYNRITKKLFNFDLVGNVLICPERIFE